VITEWSIAKLLKKSSTIGDFSAVITGILLALSVSPVLPWWMMVIGAAFSIGVVKMAFGGLGNNFLNPALAGRAFLTAAYPVAMSQWLAPRWGSLSGIDGISSATPLMYFKTTFLNGSFNFSDYQEVIPNLLFGNVGGCIGETSVIALLIGASLLMFKRIISYRIPLFFISTVFFLFWIFNGTGSWFTLNSIFVPLFQILSGGLILGAFFMATDMVTSPITPSGQLIFGICCGFLTFIIRKFGGYPDGVAFSILLMNLAVPYLNLYTRPRVYGEVKKSD
jgi:electron transport complex protein RnfD